MSHNNILIFGSATHIRTNLECLLSNGRNPFYVTMFHKYFFDTWIQRFFPLNFSISTSALLSYDRNILYITISRNNALWLYNIYFRTSLECLLPNRRNQFYVTIHRNITLTFGCNALIVA